MGVRSKHCLHPLRRHRQHLIFLTMMMMMTRRSRTQPKLVHDLEELIAVAPLAVEARESVVVMRHLTGSVELHDIVCVSVGQSVTEVVVAPIALRTRRYTSQPNHKEAWSVFLNSDWLALSVHDGSTLATEVIVKRITTSSRAMSLIVPPCFASHAVSASCSRSCSAS